MSREKFELMDGEVRVWIEQETIHMIAKDLRYNDPVELPTHMARELATALLRMADLIDE